MKFYWTFRYIPYALGGGYVLGRALVEFLATNSHQVQANFRMMQAYQGWNFCIFREPGSEPKKIKEPKKLEVKRGEREKEKRRGKKEKRG